MKLLIISSPDPMKQEATMINRLFESGLKHFHLRKPGWSQKEITTLLKSIKSQYYERIVVHTCLQLAVDFGLGGIHFNSKTKDQPEQWSSFEGSRSISCHRLQELEQLPPQIAYAFLSPIFPSISKPGYQTDFNRGELQYVLSTYQKAKVIALGGVAPGNIQTCRQIGFDGVAVLGSIWQKDCSPKSIINQFLQLNEQTADFTENINQLNDE